MHRILLLAMTTALLQGCLTIGEPQSGVPLTAREGNGIVVGRIRVLADDGEQFPWNIDAVVDLSREILHTRPPPLQRPVLGVFSVDRDERAMPPEPDEAGWFAWELAPGRYLLYVLDSLHGGYTPELTPVAPPLRVLAAFEVSAAGAAAYVGELVIETRAYWLAGHKRADYEIGTVSVQSVPADAQRWVARRHPGTRLATAATGLLVDPALAALFRDYSKSAAESILARLGMGTRQP